MSETITTNNEKGLLLRRFLFLGVLILAFIGANLLYLPALNYNAVQSAAAGDLLYAAGFDGFADEWQLYEGRNFAQMSAGQMQLSLEVNDIIYSASSPVYGDFDAEISVLATSGAEESDGFGLIFRLSDANDELSCLRAVPMLCSIEKTPILGAGIALIAPAPKPKASGYYAFLISPDGYYSIWARNDNNQLDRVTVWHNSNDLLNTGLNVENRIRIIGRGADFQFYLNGSLVNLCIPLAGEQPTGNAEACLGTVTDTWHDERFATGKLGLILNGSTVAPVSAAFDNFVVRMPEAVSEGDGL